MMTLKLILPPIAGAIIGFSANWLAIKLLFRPYAPVPLFGYKLQGFITKRRKDISHSLAVTVENELLSAKDITEVLNGVDWKSEIEAAIEETVDHRFGRSLKGIPVIGLLSENVKYHIKYILTKEALEQIDKKKETLSNKFIDNIDIKKRLVNKIDSIEITRFEQLLTEVVARELKHLGILGAIVGFVLGAIQSLIFYLIG